MSKHVNEPRDERTNRKLRQVPLPNCDVHPSCGSLQSNILFLPVRSIAHSSNESTFGQSNRHYMDDTEMALLKACQKLSFITVLVLKVSHLHSWVYEHTGHLCKEKQNVTNHTKHIQLKLVQTDTSQRQVKLLKV